VLREPAASIFRWQNEQAGSSFLQNVCAYVPNDMSQPQRKKALAIFDRRMLRIFGPTKYKNKEN
jgi:hypothetical protein